MEGIPMPTENKLDHSRQFDRWRLSDHKNVKQVEDVVFSKIKPKLITVPDMKKLRTHFKMILLDLIVAYLTDPKLYIAISRDKNRYVKGTRYRALYMSHLYTMAALDCLYESGYIEQHKGFQDVVNRMTRIKSKPKLIKLFKLHKLESYMINCEPDTKLIYLKNEDGKDIEYEETGYTKMIRSNLIKINSLLADSNIDLRITDTMHSQILRDLAVKNDEEKKRWRPLKGKANPYRMVTVDFSRNQLKRIFIDGVWDKGGRFYSVWWQSIPSKYRKYIRINERSTVELDFKQMHPTILYSLYGEALKDDPYTLDGFDKDSRGDLKIVLNTMINAADDTSAKRSLQYGMPKASLPDGYDSLDDVFEAFKTKHSVIADYFFTGYGKSLQFIDSVIAQDIMLKLNNYGVVCLPVHDSFIVASTHEQLLRDVMHRVFKARVGQIAQIKKDKTIYNGMKRAPELSGDDTIKYLEQLKHDGETGDGIYSKYHQRKTEWYMANARGACLVTVNIQ